MIKISRSRDHLIFNVWIPIPEKDGLYIKMVPRLLKFPCKDDLHMLHDQYHVYWWPGDWHMPSTPVQETAHTLQVNFQCPQWHLHPMLMIHETKKIVLYSLSSCCFLASFPWVSSPCQPRHSVALIRWSSADFPSVVTDPHAPRPAHGSGSTGQPASGAAKIEQGYNDLWAVSLQR